jgi:hypothetical protein
LFDVHPYIVDDPEDRPVAMRGSTHEKPELADGWSYPITSFEAEAYFPNVGHVSGRAAPNQDAVFGAKDEVLIILSWHPRISRPQPILTVRAVRTCRRDEVRTWIDEVVAPQAREWLESLPDRNNSWRERAHTMRWKWRIATSAPQ